MSIETFKNPLFVSLVFYIVLLIVIFLSNITNKFGREKQMLFYYIISIIVPVLIYIFVIIALF